LTETQLLIPQFNSFEANYDAITSILADAQLLIPQAERIDGDYSIT
jgi:hypothetical protein